MVHIELKTIKPLKHSNYDIIISTSLFKMKESYRKFPEYITGFLNWFPKIPRATFVRMYIDSSVLGDNDFQKIIDLKATNLEIIQFYCPDFFIEEKNKSKDSKILKSLSKSKSIILKTQDTIFPKGYHDGTFGSIIRMIPLFEKPMGVKYIWVSDTDMPTKVFNYRFIKLMQEKNAKVFYYSKSCYDKPWSEGIHYPVLAGRLIMSSKIEFNKGNLTRFLNDILKGKYQDVFDDVKKHYEGTFRSFENTKYFPYGFDELFTNKYLYPVFKQYKRIITFEIGFPKEFMKENILEIKDKIKKKAFANAYFKSWNYKLKQDEYKFLVDTMNELFLQSKQVDLSLLNPERAEQLKICIKDFEEHKEKINVVPDDVGISTWVVKNANQE
jgi:hypothetical protein